MRSFFDDDDNDLDHDDDFDRVLDPPIMEDDERETFGLKYWCTEEQNIRRLRGAPPHKLPQ